MGLRVLSVLGRHPYKGGLCKGRFDCSLILLSIKDISRNVEETSFGIRVDLQEVVQCLTKLIQT